MNSEDIKRIAKEWAPLFAIFGVVIGVAKIFSDSYGSSDLEGKMILLSLLSFLWTTFVLVVILLRIQQKKTQKDKKN